MATFSIEDVFEIQGRGVVLTGTVAEGSVKIGLRAEVSGGVELYVEGIERFNKSEGEALAGEAAGLLVRVENIPGGAEESQPWLKKMFSSPKNPAVSLLQTLKNKTVEFR